MSAYYYGQVILEVSKFLAQRPANAVELSSRDKAVIRLALEFLRRVLAGREVINNRSALVADLGSIDAYAFARQALRSDLSKLSPAQGLANQRMFEKAVWLLEQIENGVALVDLPQGAIEETRDLFDQLARFAFASAVDDIEPSSLKSTGVLNSVTVSQAD